MIPIEKLAAVTTLVCHQNGDGSPCPDGVASALILRDVLPDATVTFVAHDALESLEARPNMLFCDIAPSASRAEEFLAVGAIVLDHHRTAQPVVARFGELGVFADEKLEPGVSGAVLAYREVWKPLAWRGAQRPRNHRVEGRGAATLARFAKIAGVRDTWQRSSEWWDEACEQAAALTFWPWQDWPTLLVLDLFASEETLSEFSSEAEEMLGVGRILVAKRLRETRKAINEGWRYTTRRGTRVLVVATRETSDIAEEVGETADLVIGFSYLNGAPPGGAHEEKMIVSTRSHTTFDCAAFAKAFGGGGHTRAAGFTHKLAHDDRQPYTAVTDMLEAFEYFEHLDAATPAS